VPALPFDPIVAGDPAAPALIGVSGGRDSVALLHALVKADYSRLVVCHFDHGWRAESAAEARFTAGLAQRYGLDFVTERCASPAPREAAAREARYAFFARTAAARGCMRVLLAHHADDQIETFLFNLLRGAGGSGLGGMQPISSRTIEGVELEIARPLLGCWREEIDAYIAAAGLEFCEDPSNADPQHTRSRLRHDILPALASAFGRPVRGNLWKAATILAAENEFFSSLEQLREVPAELKVRTVRDLPLALQRRLLLAWLQSHAIPAISFDDVEAVRALLINRSPAKVNLSAGHHVRRRAGLLFIERAS
jgi:tRNA(Ile)-lysidine synthase